MGGDGSSSSDVSTGWLPSVTTTAPAGERQVRLAEAAAVSCEERGADAAPERRSGEEGLLTATRNESRKFSTELEAAEVTAVTVFL